jgi:endonuclease/exonuclease/phosphatase family metal-dependent hydrolase
MVTGFFRAMAAMIVSMICAGCASSSAVDEKPTLLTVMTYNIHHGEGTDGKLDLERIAGIIRGQNPDLVAVQEVDHKTERTGKVAQAEELGKLTGMHSVFGKAMDYQGGGYGQAILSRWPIREHQVHQLPQRDGREPRIVVSARIAAPGGELIFATAHLDHQLEEVRLKQAQEINRILNGKSGAIPLLLAGDFNAGPESTTVQEIVRDWIDTAGENARDTIPSANPRRRIDYIFAQPKDAWKPAGSQVLEEPIASDHRPVVARVELHR